MNYKEHLYNNVEGCPSQTSLSVDSEWQYHTKVYNIILSILVWVAPKILRKNVVNALAFGLH